MTTDTTPRDVFGQPLQVGRWYWVRHRDLEQIVACYPVVGLSMANYVELTECPPNYVPAERFDWLPAEGPPAWPGEAI